MAARLSYMSWNVEMDADLKRFIEAGKSFSQSAAEINATHGTDFSRNAAIGRAHRLGIKGSAISVQRNKTPRSPKPRKPKPAQVRAVAIPVEVEQPPLRCVEVVSRELDILTIGACECRYPSNDAPFTFCGNPVKVGSPYCGPHHAVCHDRIPTPRKPDAQRPGVKRSARSFFDFEAA